MELVRQPAGSSLCGQACVAMVAGIALEAAVDLFDTRGATRSRDVAKALHALGFDANVRAERVKPGVPLPATAIVRFTAKLPSGKYSYARHWIVWHNRKWYDPAAGVFRDIPKYLTLSGAKPTSYIAPVVRS